MHSELPTRNITLSNSKSMQAASAEASNERTKSHTAIIVALIGLIPICAGGAYKYGERLGALETQVQMNETKEKLTKSENKNEILEAQLQGAKSEYARLLSYYNEARSIIDKNNLDILNLRANAEKNNNCLLIHTEIGAAQNRLDYFMRENYNGQYQAEIASLHERIRGFQNHLGTCGNYGATK